MQENIKKCCICGLNKSLDEFYFRKDTNKYRNNCKNCHDSKNKKYYEKHKENIRQYGKDYYQVNSEDRKIYAKKYKKENKEAYAEYRKENKETISIYNKKYKEENKEFIREQKNKYERDRKKNDPAYAFRCLMSSAINYGLKRNGGSKLGESCIQYLDYTIQEFLNHLASQMIGENVWMHFKNHGIYNAKTWDDNDPSTWTWQIDHIIPHSEFHYETMEDEDFKKCWALENLRPLSAKQNILDGIRRTRHQKKND